MERKSSTRVACRRAVLARIALVSLFAASGVHAATINIQGPQGSGAFGTFVTVLPNGNIVVTDPSGPVSNVGAVNLLSPTGTIISTLTGSQANDQVGWGGVVVLSNGNFVVRSPFWRNGSAAQAGAVTWVNGTTGLSGAVSASNSLVGSNTNDLVGGGTGTVVALSNGHYVVTSPNWDNGAATDAGAASWGHGSIGRTGAVSAINSLVGSSISDFVGSVPVVEVGSGNYVVRSFNWDNGNIINAGAATWGNGSSIGVVGPISAANSLIGTHDNDLVGIGESVIRLSNGNYIVRSPLWDSDSATDVGAVSWGLGSVGVTGVVSAANSLVGSSSGDSVGSFQTTALSNGNYVVASPNWDKGGILRAGAVTWANGSVGLTGPVTAANSLTGNSNDDAAGEGGVTALTNNGNYVVSTPLWNNGATMDAGAVTWANGSTGLTGLISTSNSLYATQNQDKTGSSGVTALSNGNYVVASADWNGLGSNVGAVTWCDGVVGRTGTVSILNSLRGSSTDDHVGGGGVTALSNGHFVVRSPDWDHTAVGAANAGAATWVTGTAEFATTVDSSNSLVGSSDDDAIGSLGIVALVDGDYVVTSPMWNNGGTADVGAVTWGSGSAGISGAVSASNSLVGSRASDRIGNFNGFQGVLAQSDGNYVVRSSFWDLFAIIDGAGAVTLARGDGSAIGALTFQNSVIGSMVGGGGTHSVAYDPALEQLVVGRPLSNIVTLFTPSEQIFADGFE